MLKHQSEQEESSHNHNPSWRTFKVFYFDPDKDSLLLDGIVPAVKALQQSDIISSYYCQRHWLHGPHLRVNVHFTSPSAQVSGGALLKTDVQRYLSAYPSTTELHEDQYLKRYTAIAAMEIVDEPLMPLSSNNSCQWGDHQMRTVMYGTAPGAKLCRLFLTDAQPLINQLLERSRSQPNKKLFSMARLMMAFAASFDNITEAALSFRSHAEGYFYSVPNSEVLRQRFDAAYQTHASGLQSVLEGILTGNEKDTPVKEWAELLKHYQTVMFKAIQDGILRLPTRDEFAALKARLPQTTKSALKLEPRISPYHISVLDPNSELSRKLRQPETQVRALLVNLMYSKLTLVGIRPLERMFLCDLVGRAFEDKFGIRHHIEAVRLNHQESA